MRTWTYCRRSVLAGMAGVLVSGGWGATTAALAQGAQTQVPAAKLMRVDDGVFELRPGKSIDLTNRKVLLAFKSDQSDRELEKGRFVITISGEQRGVSVGTRIDLKRLRELAATLKDKDECFLDVVDFVAPKGAPPTATFRLSCL